MISKLIDKVYVINLKRCIDRKKHIQQEFAGVIDDYEIFEATDNDSVHVKRMMETDFVKKFPPCFRCGKNRCDCSNNVLIKNQIGNWCSFINVMNEIVKTNNRYLTMICEDDVKFVDGGMHVLNRVLTKNTFKEHNISFDKPILIRAEHRGPLQPVTNTKLTNNIVMSNACFIVNTHYAESFLNNLKRIDTTSDIYIHRRLPQHDKTIQHVTIEPGPVYQLSDNENPMFMSEIHPKGINEEDKLRVKKHIKRVEYDQR